MINKFDHDDADLPVSKKTLTAKAEDPRWAKGPFYDIKYKMGPKIKGAVFERITSQILRALGVKVTGSTTNTKTNRKSSDYDRIIDGSKYEIKGSCASTTAKEPDIGQYTFLQIRPAQEYDALLLVTFWHDGTVSMYSIPKEDVKQFVKAGVFKKQHGGNTAESGTYSYNGTIAPFEQYHVLTRKVVGGDIDDPEIKKTKEKGAPKQVKEPVVVAKSPEEREAEISSEKQFSDTVASSPEIQELIRSLKLKGADMESAFDDIKHYILQGQSPKEVVNSINELYESRKQFSVLKTLISKVSGR